MKTLIDSLTALIDASFALFPFMVIGAVVLLLKHRREEKWMFLVGCWGLCAIIRICCGITTSRYCLSFNIFGIPLSIIGLYWLASQVAKYGRKSRPGVIMCGCLAILELICLGRTFRPLTGKPFLQQLSRAIAEDVTRRRLQRPLILVNNQIAAYLKYYHNHKAFPVEWKQLEELTSILKKWDGGFDGVYLVMDSRQSPPPTLTAKDHSEYQLFFSAPNRKKYVAAYFGDYTNTGRPLSSCEVEGTFLENGRLTQSGPAPEQARKTLLARGYRLPESTAWPVAWTVNPAHYWAGAASPDEGLSVNREGGNCFLSLRGQGRLTVYHQQKFDMESYRGIVFRARGEPGSVFRLLIQQEDAGRHRFTASRTLSVDRKWHHYEVTWQGDFRTEHLLDRDRCNLVLELSHGNIDLDDFQFLGSEASIRDNSHAE